MEHHNSGTPHDDVLSRTTARLSISTEDKNVIKQVREFLADHKQARRDSAVSITSNDGEAKHFVEFEKLNDETSKAATGSFNESKRRRRRSSVQPVLEPKAKKLHKKKARKGNEPVTFVVDDEFEKPMVIRQLQAFLQELVLGRFGNIKKRFRINKPQSISKVVFVFVPGLYETDFNFVADAAESVSKRLDKSACQPPSFFYRHFDQLLPLTASGSKDSTFLCSQALVNFAPTKADRKRRLEELKERKIVLYDLLLSTDQMRSYGYPLHSLQLQELPEEGWVETKDFQHDGSHTFAVDCEFCQADTRQVLTRISMVNFQGEVVYDSYVKPREHITDYLTKYSGITEKHLEDVTTTLEDVQQKILLLVSSTDILIGHSLNSDLCVLKIKHPRVIDTAVIFHHNRGPPSRPSLKWLTLTHLLREIQQGEQTGAGHSSVEDLLACLDLVKIKLVEGMEFGWVPRETTIFERMNAENTGKSAAIIDYHMNEWGPYINEQPDLELIKISNDDMAAEKAVTSLEKCSLVFVKLKEICRDEGNIERGELLARLDSRLQKMYDALPQNAVLIVASEGGDNREMLRLQKVRRNFNRLGDSEAAVAPAEERWDFEKTNALHEATTEARRALTFVTVKP